MHFRGDRLQVAAGAELVVVNDNNITGDALAVFEPAAVSVHRVRPSEGSPRNCWEGAITDIHVDGQRARVRVDAALPVTAEITAAAVAELGLTQGTTVWVSVKATDIAVSPD